MKNKFHKGQKVYYLGNEAVIKSVKFCIYSQDYYYNVKYTKGLKFGVTTYEKSNTITA
jgi:uracil DNA glycosylase